MLTKQQEVKTLRDIITSIPQESYLSDYMAGAVEDFETMIRQDLAIPRVDTLHSVQGELIRQQKELVELSKKVQAAKEELKDIEKRKARAESDMADIRRAAMTLAAGK